MEGSETEDNYDDHLVSFGKHENLTFLELAETRKDYIGWLFKQSWFETKYNELYTYLIGRGFSHPHGGDDDDNYISHNKYQALFADRAYLMEVVEQIDERIHSIDEVVFEDGCNADIVVYYTTRTWGWFGYNTTSNAILIELKPAVSNEYPEILRQIRAQKRTFRIQNPTIAPGNIRQALVLRSYTGEVNLETVRSMFAPISIIISE